MKSIQLKPVLLIAIVLTVILSACGAKATPTPDVQATAMAAASTMIAETRGRAANKHTHSTHACGNRHPATYTDYSAACHGSDSRLTDHGTCIQ